MDDLRYVLMIFRRLMLVSHSDVVIGKVQSSWRIVKMLGNKTVKTWKALSVAGAVAGLLMSACNHLETQQLYSASRPSLSGKSFYHKSASSWTPSGITLNPGAACCWNQTQSTSCQLSILKARLKLAQQMIKERYVNRMTKVLLWIFSWNVFSKSLSLAYPGNFNLEVGSFSHSQSLCEPLRKCKICTFLQARYHINHVLMSLRNVAGLFL